MLCDNDQVGEPDRAIEVHITFEDKECAGEGIAADAIAVAVQQVATGVANTGTVDAENIIPVGQRLVGHAGESNQSAVGNRVKVHFELTATVGSRKISRRDREVIDIEGSAEIFVKM